MNRKIIFFGLCLGLATLFFSVDVQAKADYGIEGTKAMAKLPNDVAGAKDVTGLVGVIVKVVLEVVGTVFFLLVLYAGLNWMMARGNAEKIEKSKDMVIDAVIGIVIVSAAWAITNFVFENLKTTTPDPSPTGEQVCMSGEQICLGKKSGMACVMDNDMPGRCEQIGDECACQPDQVCVSGSDSACLGQTMQSVCDQSQLGQKFCRDSGNGICTCAY